MTEIAVLGAGRMGASIALRLLDAGHQVAVWNRTAARAAPLGQAGARVARTPADAARHAEVTVTMLTDAAAVQAVLFGPDGAVPALPPDACLVEMSTIGPTAVRDLATRLPATVSLVDAPVGGSVAAARAGRLRVFAGGTDVAVARVTPVLAALGDVRHCGGTGSGAALKLVLNTALLVAVAGLADTLAVARAVGVDPATALDALVGGPLGGVLARAAAPGADFPVALAGKDLDLVRDALGAAPAPLVRAARTVLAAAEDPTADIATLVPLETP
ncbi:NAD(P)-dependent oxidoreductase [Micromonospora peucetia]|uniref:3-hydroxyisobutyrate dehydrogenase n=1 Tax=Micromonospora peucetia TaxID=47871 RepID=A0A1C6VYJ5_9ACTN|nr:NAD(P)-dependent oxidoreductase [Micromonospora peucetia]MCX4390596.1 NAD(P)-dependent oxidoreductase [Micromonospora peucetia]WSA31534.1 NAD(P)-dependent oxidoreductase [Micromonospora peucetia]SCL71194.1 3-hydroxyisobutyrate dehydrogenase [Micromonospora peucetia]